MSDMAIWDALLASIGCTYGSKGCTYGSKWMHFWLLSHDYKSQIMAILDVLMAIKDALLADFWVVDMAQMGCINGALYMHFWRFMHVLLAQKGCTFG